MKTRAFLTIAFLLFLILPLLFFWFESSAFVAPPTPSHAPAVSSPTVTPTPTLGEKITQGEKNVFDPIVAALSYAAVMLITVLVLFLIWRIWHLSGLSHLVIDPFTNATGDEALEKALPGLNLRTREKLVEAFGSVHRRVIEPPDLDRLKRFPVPENASYVQLTSLLNSLTEVASGSEKIVMQLLNLVILPRGSRVITTLQSLGDTPPILGISLQLVDLEGIQNSASVTFWEPVNISGKGVSQSATGSPASTTPVPPQENTDALACYTLGEIYEERGALDQAKTQYENALTKQPNHDMAKEALERVLGKRKTLDERYTKLMDPAQYWLAIELIGRAIKADAQRIDHRFRRWILRRGHRRSQAVQYRVNYLAQLYNFLGFLHLDGGQKFEQFPEFYSVAIDYFAQAIDFDRYWFLPYENLGFTFLLLVMMRDGKEQLLELSPQSRRDLYEARNFFGMALTTLQEGMNVRGTLSDEKVLAVRRQLLVGKSIVLLKLGDISEAVAEIRKLREEWDLTREKDSMLLYNLACWYGIADNLPDDKKGAVADSLPANEERTTTDPRQVARQTARRYVVYSLTRKPDYWYTASKDPNFTTISDYEGWEQLEAALTRKLIDHPDLAEMTGVTFDDEITELLVEIKWVKVRKV